MKTKLVITIIKNGIALFMFLIISFNSFSQSCHNGGSNNGSDKGIVKTVNYKKSTKKTYYVCKKHPNIKYNSKGNCSVCNKKLKKKFEYCYD
ncbi:MAG: hypothetical protein HY951_01080 [Bacteroidia bacterium]|nr:hypothetical protein [Bacteroidia bacterium]